VLIAVEIVSPGSRRNRLRDQTRRIRRRRHPALLDRGPGRAGIPA
jgi:hypothetical protein